MKWYRLDDSLPEEDKHCLVAFDYDHCGIIFHVLTYARGRWFNGTGGLYDYYFPPFAYAYLDTEEILFENNEAEDNEEELPQITEGRLIEI